MGGQISGDVLAVPRRTSGQLDPADVAAVEPLYSMPIRAAGVYPAK